MTSQCVSTCTRCEMATQRHTDVWTTFRQVPAVLACSVYCCGPLAAAILSSQCDMEPNRRYALREREREGERSRLTFLCFPVNQDYSSYLMMQKQSNMTFKVTILYRGTATPPPCTLNIHRRVHGLLISTLTRLPNQDKW